ncbi:Crp/Fnr family transcriptional regulator [Streptomyces sp. WMMC500]|uniref:Crp/Fnr family transcriptional regulator n=1 Tax=Streptomyces sp. WMMC500 TaxID=3015154 RepID=UPI00248BD93D|nr:Crp/Fnr family transcriptional regulator [Streptomyces sp. WMMC500]WBB59024.1 Crp/Fnr family transcriptional regulator [Streptomyces sp. WMMC500]
MRGSVSPDTRNGTPPEADTTPPTPAAGTPGGQPADPDAAPEAPAALHAVPLLRGLPPARLHALWQRSVPRRYAAGEVLRAAGEPAGHLLLLLDGRVAATVVSAAGRVVRVGAWAGPCALDKVAVIDDRGHTATLTAVTPCTVRSLPRADFLALVDDATAVRAHVLRTLAAQARDQQTRFTATATLPASARLAAWLLAEAARLRSSRVPLPGGQQPLADHLGVTRVTLNRALSGLRRDGLLTYARGEVEILAPETLALRAAPEHH